MGAMTNPRVSTSIKAGTSVVIDGRYGIIKAITSTELLVQFNAYNFSVSRHDEHRVEPVAVPWADFADLAGDAFVMDQQSRTEWQGFRPHNQRKLLARLAVVNLTLTGARSGQPDLEPDDRIVELAPVSNPKITPRSKVVKAFLAEGGADWVPTLLADLNANSKPGQSVVLTVPDERSIHRWVHDTVHAGVFALVDDRGGNRTEGTERGKRRENTERLIDKVIEGRSPRHRSSTSNKWVMDQVRTLATAEGVLLLARTQFAELVAAKLQAAGRKPSQVKTAKHHKDRREHQNRRPIYVGEVEALDATLGDVLVRMTPDGEPIRCYVHVCVEASTGVISSVHASGKYASVHVGALLHDAFTPSLLVPDPDEVVRARMKGQPSFIVAQERVFKPGAIPGRIRSDNIAANHSNFVVGIGRHFGCDISPSRPGVSPDNGIAEAAIGATYTFMEGQPGFVGRDTTERATGVAEGEILLIEEFEARLQHWAYFEHNHSRTTAPLFRNTGLSRLQQWDHMIEYAGAPPMLLDRNGLFSFLPRKIVTRTPKGVRVGNHHFSDAELFRLPKHVVDQNRQVTVIYDPRRHNQVWIEDPIEGAIHSIPNVLRDVMEGPLTKEITAAALKRARLRSLDGYHAATAFAHHAQIVAREERTASIERELADWRASLRAYDRAMRGGAVVMGEQSMATERGVFPAEAAAEGGSPRTSRKEAPGMLAEDAYDLDRPILRRQEKESA